MSTILNKNTDGTRTVPLGERELMQELTIGSDDYGKIKVGTDGTLGGEVLLAKDEDVVTNANNIATNTSDILTKTNTSIPLSSQLKGTYSLSNTVKTLAFDAIIYTGNGTSQEIVTGLSTIDFTQASNGTGYYHDRVAGDCIVKNDAGTIVESGEIAFKHFAGVDGVCKVHIKSRSNALSNYVFDGVRGVEEYIATDLTNSEFDYTNSLVAFSTTGFTVGSAIGTNTNLATYISYVTLYTHIKWGLTNQGKRYIEAYNPVTNDTMIMYQGSGVAGHEIPHSVGVELDYFEVKDLSDTSAWNIYYGKPHFRLSFDTVAEIDSATSWDSPSYADHIAFGYGGAVNQSGITNILYGKAKSKTWTIVQYTGTGVAGNFIETKDVDGIARRPARVIIKAVSRIGSWETMDNARANDGHLIRLESSGTELIVDYLDFNVNGFEITADGTTWGNANKENEQYIALVEFDTDGTGTDGSYFDMTTDITNLQLDSGILSISNGYDSNGASNKVISKDGTVIPSNGWQ